MVRKKPAAQDPEQEPHEPPPAKPPAEQEPEPTPELPTEPAPPAHPEPEPAPAEPAVLGLPEAAPQLALPELVEGHEVVTLAPGPPAPPPETYTHGKAVPAAKGGMLATADHILPDSVIANPTYYTNTGQTFLAKRPDGSTAWFRIDPTLQGYAGALVLTRVSG